MDAFSPRQFGWQPRHLQSLITTSEPDSNIHNTKTEHDSSAATIKDHSPVVNAFKVITLLNVPAISAFTWMYIGCIWRTAREFREWKANTVLGHLSALILPSEAWRDWQKKVSRDRFHELIKPPLGYIAFNPLSNFDKPWTLITSSFVHVDLSHFVGNMLALRQLAPVCAQVSGLSVPHICNIVLGSGVCGCIGTWIEFYLLRANDPHDTVLKMYEHSFGASDIVSAFAAIATVARPRTWTEWNLYVVEFRVQLCVLTLFNFGYDALELLRRLLPLNKGSRPPMVGPGPGVRVGHSAHLMAGLFGMLYYLLFLKSGDSTGIVTRTGTSKENEVADKSRSNLTHVAVADLGEQTLQSAEGTSCPPSMSATNCTISGT